MLSVSESQLNRSQEKAMEHHLDIVFKKLDAKNLPFLQEFDLAIMLCEGSFPLMEKDEMNDQILKSVAKTLKSQEKFILLP